MENHHFQWVNPLFRLGHVHYSHWNCTSATEMVGSADFTRKSPWKSWQMPLANENVSLRIYEIIVTIVDINMS